VLTQTLLFLLASAPSVATDCSIRVVPTAEEQRALQPPDPVGVRAAFEARGWSTELGKVDVSRRLLELHVIPRGRARKRCVASLSFRWPGVDSNGDPMTSARVWTAKGRARRADLACAEAIERIVVDLQRELWRCPA
jgi:hypothetical protein